MGLVPPDKFLFDGRAPDIQRIAAKVVDLSGLAVRIRQRVDRHTAEVYEMDGSLAFECAPRDEIKLCVYRPGGISMGELSFYDRFADGEEYQAPDPDAPYAEPPGKQTLRVWDGVAHEQTFRSYVFLALKALGGEAKRPLDEASRRLCVGPITELELERRKWEESGRQLLATLTGGFAEVFYLLAFGITFSHRQWSRPERPARHVLVRVALFPFKLVFSILGAIMMAIVLPLVGLYLAVTFAAKTARLALHLYTRRDSTQGWTPEKAEEAWLTPAGKRARNMLKNLKQTYGAPEIMVPASEAEFSHLDLRGYRRFRADMEAQGYSYVGDFEIRVTSQASIAMFVRTMIRVMVSQDGSIAADYYQHKQRRWPLIKELAAGLIQLSWLAAPKYFARDVKTRHYVDFSTAFDDGRWLTASNAEAAGKITMPPALERHFFPYGTATPVLLDAHRKRMAEIMQASPGIKPLVASTAEDILQAYARLSALKCAYRASVQWITQDELRAMSGGNHAYADEVYAEIQKRLERETAEARQAG